MMETQKDVIAAIATPIGMGGISIIRISGEGALGIVDSVFSGKEPLAGARGYTAHYGKIVSAGGELIDEAVVVVYRPPHSYTTEEMAEINCHGGIFVTRRILQELLRAGARTAEPGEFTRRAFLNGRIDLAQAEAVADLIMAGSEAAHRASREQLEGKFSAEINTLRDKLIDLAGTLELELDFIEEDLEFQDRSELQLEIESIGSIIQNMVKSYEIGKLYREGVKTVIVGKPNVGKSSILNSLLNENRAIVTEIAGTTRDIIEENVIIEDILFRLVDTAGVRESHDPIEYEGILRTKYQVKDADILLFIADPIQGYTDEDKEILSWIVKENQLLEKALILAINKIDISESIEEFKSEIIRDYPRCVPVSAMTREGFSELTKLMAEVALRKREGIEKSYIITNERHKEALTKASESLKLALASLAKGMSNELISLDIRGAIDDLGEIIGIVRNEEILDRIFSRFCIGK